jgi:hypothetical protein
MKNEELKDIARAMPKVLSLGVGSLNPYPYFDPLQAEDGCEGMVCVLGTATVVIFDCLWSGVPRIVKTGKELTCCKTTEEVAEGK